MARPSPPLQEPPRYSDGLGERTVIAGARTGELLQVLRIHPALARVTAFEFALRERISRLGGFRHPSYTIVRSVDRIRTPETGIAVVADHVEGTRLSVLLTVAQRRRMDLDISTALCLLRQTVTAVAVLHGHARGVSHGLLGPERILVTPQCRVVVLDHVFGGAIEQLQLDAEQLWREFGVAVAPSGGPCRLDQPADIRNLGLIALALLLGRPLEPLEFPSAIPALLDGARERTALGYERPLSPPIRDWLGRALQLDAHRAFSTVMEAAHALRTIAEDPSAYVTSRVSVEMFLSQCTAALVPPVQPAQPVRTARPEADRKGPTLSLLPAPPVPTVGETDDIDWDSIVGRPSAVATALDISELLSDSAPAAGDTAAAPAADLIGTESSFPNLPSAPGAPAVPLAIPGHRSGWRRRATLAVLLAVALGSAAVLTRSRLPGLAAHSVQGTVVVQSNPSGLRVLIDGEDRGTTPTRIPVRPGDHTLEVRGDGGARTVPFSIAPAAEISHHLEFAGSTRTTAADDLRDAVSIGTGVALASPAPVDRGPAAPKPRWGWLTVTAAVPLEVRAGGRVIGSTDVERIRIAPGAHSVLLTNESLGIREHRVVHVAAGKIATLALAHPQGSIHINASPWAEVWIGGRRIGETPLGNVSLPVGHHDIVFRHPEFGDKQQSVRVRPGSTVHVTMDMK